MSKSMKKLSLFSGLLLLAGLMGVSIQIQRAEARQTLATATNTNPESTRERIWVRNVLPGGTLQSGAIVVWNTGSQITGVEVTSTTTYGNALFAGIVPASTTIATGEYGWIQVAGYHPSIQIASNTSAGSFLTTSGTGQKASVYAVAISTLTSDANTDGVQVSTDVANALSIWGIALDATTSSTTVKGWIFNR